MPLASLAFKAEATTLREAFSGRRGFAVPMFQRSYSWTTHEIGLLMSDLWLGVKELEEQAGAYGGLFMGSIVVVRDIRAVSQDLPDQIVDGKQRLTSLTILIAALHDKLGAQAPWLGEMLWVQAESSEPPLSRLTLDVEEDNYFDAQVRRPGATRDPVEPQTDSPGPRCIRDCQKLILEDLADRGEDDLLLLARFLRDEVAFVMIAAPDIDTGFRIFVTTNHRGKQLASTDILKAELIASLPLEARDRALERWRGVERELGAEFEQLPGYLRTIQHGGRGTTIREVLEIVQKRGGAQRFLDDLLFPMADALSVIVHANFSGSPHSERVNRALRILGWLKARDWVAPALAYACRFPGQQASFAVFLEALDRLAYGLQVAGITSDRRMPRYRQVIDGLDTGMAIDGSSAPLALEPAEQAKLILNASSNLYARSTANCKVLLKRISACYPDDELVDSLSDVTVEHVLPTNIPDKSPWLAEFPDASERQACNKLLGNLVLITRQQNKDARNQSLEAKMRAYFPAGAPTPHAITNQLIGASGWNAADVRNREFEMQKRIREIWNIAAPMTGASRRSDRSA